MKIRIQVVIDAEDGDGEKVEDIVQLERRALRPEELGLTLTEAKAILHGMQRSLITEQVAAYLPQFKICPDCGEPRTRKGYHPIVYHTLFGKCNLLSPRADHARLETATTEEGPC
jgi:hypothetical protein